MLCWIIVKKYHNKQLFKHLLTSLTVLNDVRRAQQTSMAASNEAQAAYDFANQAKELSMRELEEVTSLNGKIADFTLKDRATPENVKEVAEQVKFFIIYYWKTFLAYFFSKFDVELFFKIYANFL